jgi:hypothetical protein
MRLSLGLLGGLGYALWLAVLYLLLGASGHDSEALSVVMWLDPTGRVVTAIQPLLTARYGQ